MPRMSAADPAVHIPPDRRTEAVPPTPGIVREQAFATEGMWAGVATTGAGATSGWHHHGDYDTAIYVVSGSLVLESGPGGAEVIDARPGAFVFVPKGAIHRETNASDVDSHVVVVRAGSGPPVVNVDGPAPG